MEVFMTFLLLAGCTVVTVDALRHVLGGCVFYEFCVFQVIFGDFGELLWIWELSGCRGAAGGAPRRQMTRKRRPQAQKGVPFGDTFGSWRHHFPQCFFTCFRGALFPACGAIWDDFWGCFGRYLGSPGPLEIMPKCTTI